MNAPSLHGFVEAANDFCSLATRSEPVAKQDLWVIRELLLRLIFHIPAVENHPHAADNDGRRIDEPEFVRAVKHFSGLPFGAYRVVFNPHDFEATDEPVVGLLSDDLADIYRDLAQGLDNALAGHLDDACFEWSHSYQSHWGRHAVNALAAIEIYRNDSFQKIIDG